MPESTREDIEVLIGYAVRSLLDAEMSTQVRDIIRALYQIRMLTKDPSIRECCKKAIRTLADSMH